jgi:O-glycosyl hydrolase
MFSLYPFLDDNMKRKAVTGFLMVCLAWLPEWSRLSAQVPCEPLMNYTFADGTITDLAGNTMLHLRNGTALFEDPSRGKVLRFTSQERSYAVLDKQLLDRDTFTVAFFFYWEDAGSTSWHQLFEIYNWQTGSNIYLTPANGWDSRLSFFSDCREYSSFEGVYSQIIPRNQWVHLAVTLNNKDCRLYVDGIEAGRNTLMFTPSIVSADSLLFGGNPYRSDNYYVTARYDDIMVFREDLAPNQLKAILSGSEIPEPEDHSTSWEPAGNTIHIAVDLADEKQTISNFGASDGWNTEMIGKYWPLEKKEKLAGLIFSTGKDADGNPSGIGLSSWRFNIGAGTAEQGDSSRISMESRRTEGFLEPNGTYDWTKQAGQQWFLEQAAKIYNVHHLIGWQNSPPVRYTYNNLGFREYGAPMATILKNEHFGDFGYFLADVVQHFDSAGIHFHFISPLNEPQYPWSPAHAGGTVTQEGTPWTNQEIHDVVTAISRVFDERNINTRLFICEAGAITHLLRGTGHAENQLYNFWDPASPLCLTGEHAFADIVSYHSYWNDYGNPLVDERNELRDRTDQLDPVPELWQTEYSMMGEGYRGGYPGSHLLTEMECGLSLARVMMADLNIAGTSAWQWWTMFEYGKFGGESRFCLIEAFTNKEKTDGVYHPNKLFFTFGNFSHFIRPGMTRLGTSRSDNVPLYLESSNLSFSAYSNDARDHLVVVAVNPTAYAREVSLALENAGDRIAGNICLYLTDQYNNLEMQEMGFTPDRVVIPAHSVVTITADLFAGSDGSEVETAGSAIRVYFKGYSEEIFVETIHGSSIEAIYVYSLAGVRLQSYSGSGGRESVHLPAGMLAEGVYVVLVRTEKGYEAGKVLVSRTR